MAHLSPLEWMRRRGWRALRDPDGQFLSAGLAFILSSAILDPGVGSLARLIGLGLLVIGIFVAARGHWQHRQDEAEAAAQAQTQPQVQSDPPLADPPQG